MDKKGHNNHNWKKSLSQFFARPHGPEPQGLFSWEVITEAGPRHSLEMRTSEATSPNSQGSHGESDTAPRVSGSVAAPGLELVFLRAICVSSSLEQASLGKG